MAFDNPAADRKAHACPLVLAAAMQALENFKVIFNLLVRPTKMRILLKTILKP